MATINFILKRDSFATLKRHLKKKLGLGYPNGHTRHLIYTTINWLLLITWLINFYYDD